MEDEKDLVKVLLLLFKKRRIAVCFVAYDGMEALKKFIETTPKPHILIMDYRLPRMNGIDAMKEILKIDPEANILFLSADAGVKDEAMESGAYAFIKKPASIKEIDSAIQDIVEKHPGIEIYAD